MSPFVPQTVFSCSGFLTVLVKGPCKGRGIRVIWKCRCQETGLLGICSQSESGIFKNIQALFKVSGLGPKGRKMPEHVVHISSLLRHAVRYAVRTSGTLVKRTKCPESSVQDFRWWLACFPVICGCAQILGLVESASIAVHLASILAKSRN